MKCMKPMEFQPWNFTWRPLVTWCWFPACWHLFHCLIFWGYINKWYNWIYIERKCLGVLAVAYNVHGDSHYHCKTTSTDPIFFFIASRGMQDHARSNPFQKIQHDQECKILQIYRVSKWSCVFAATSLGIDCRCHGYWKGQHWEGCSPSYSFGGPQSFLAESFVFKPTLATQCVDLRRSARLILTGFKNQHAWSWSVLMLMNDDSLVPSCSLSVAYR